MNTPIFKTYEDALIAAQNQALLEADKWINDNGGDSCICVEDTVPSQWLIKNKSCQCECGETLAVTVCYFLPVDDQQFYGMAGICEACGE